MKRQKQGPKRRTLRVREPALINRIKRLTEHSEPIAAPDSATLQRWMRTYREVRAVSYRLNNKQLVPAIPEGAVGLAASNLGMLGNDNVIVFETEDETALLADHAIYNCRVDGKNTIQRYREAHTGCLQPLEDQWLKGAEQSRYTLLLLGESFPEVGLSAHDILTGERLTLADVNFSRTAVAGLTLATRIIPFDDFYMTSGAPLPIFDESVLFRIGEYLARTCSDVKDFRRLPVEQATWVEAFIVRTILEGQGADRVRYANP